MKLPEHLLEDEHWLFVNKPAGLLSVPDRYDQRLPNILHLLRKKYGPEIFIVHRLDRETSGVLVVAKTETAHRQLSLQFQQRKVEKTYLALVLGQPNPTTGTIDQPIYAPDQAKKMMVSTQGKPALTHYETLETFRGYSLVAAQPVTGRTHQIRVHLQYLGYPIVADPLYGDGKPFLLSKLKGKRKYHLGADQTERPLLARTGLHAHRLNLFHPVTGQPTTVEAPPPKDLRATLAQLRKWS